MDMIEQIEKLDRLRVQGAISDAEFDTAKRKILSEDGIQISDGTIHGIEAKTWCTIMHLSQLLAFSGVGIIAPISDRRERLQRNQLRTEIRVDPPSRCSRFVLLNTCWGCRCLGTPVVTADEVRTFER